MAKKKRASGKTNSVSEDSNETRDSPKGLSKEAWVAIGTIAAALITGTVALLTHMLPQAPASSQQAPAASQTPVVASSSRPVSPTADAIAGKWAGPATDSSGASFQITLEVRTACAVNDKCGVISVSHVPCYGEVFLEKAQDTEFEFRVDNFYGKSNRKSCQPGAGEHFSLRADGKLLYTTTYQPSAQGVLDRIGN